MTVVCGGKEPVLPRILALILASSALCTIVPTVHAWERLFYEPAETPSCLVDELTRHTDGDGCLRSEAYFEFYVFDSTADGLTPLYNSMLQLSGVSRSDIGETMGILVVQAVKRPEFGTILGWSMTEEVRVREAYLAVIGEAEIMVGQKRSVGKFDQDEARGMFGPFGSDQSNLGQFSRPLSGSYVPDSGVLLPEGLALEGLGASLQMRMETRPGWTTYAAIEEVSRTDGGALVVGSEFTGEGVNGHLTIVSDGLLDGEVSDVGAHGALSVESDLLASTFAIVATTSGYWHGLVSSEMTFGPIQFASSIEQMSRNEWGWAASIAAELGPLQTELGVREYLAPTDRAHQLAAALSYSPTDSLLARMEVGSYQVASSGYSDGGTYWAGQLVWEPGGGIRSELRYERFSNGAAITELGISKVIN